MMLTLPLLSTNHSGAQQRLMLDPAIVTSSTSTGRRSGRAGGGGLLTAAEILEIHDGLIVRGELIYDAEELRRAMRTGVSPSADDR